MFLDGIIDAGKKKVMFHSEITVRRTTRWTSVTFEQFRKTTDCKEKAAKKCLELVMEYQRDIFKSFLAA